jgi:hypothetical protein
MKPREVSMNNGSLLFHFGLAKRKVVVVVYLFSYLLSLRINGNAWLMLYATG